MSLIQRNAVILLYTLSFTCRKWHYMFRK